jgi:hypothetical protein
MWSKAFSVAWYEAIYRWLNPLGDLYMTHYVEMISSPAGALVEGWAAFVEQLFDSGGRPGEPPCAFSQLYEPQPPLRPKLILPPTYLGPMSAPIGGTLAPPGTGERVEGAFANGLWQVVVDLVDTSGNAKSQVPFTLGGDIKAFPNLGWISDPATQARFISMIWEPLKALSSHSEPTTTAYLREMKRLNAGDWHRILDALQRWDLARNPPTARGIVPASGLSGGGTTVTITGGEFAAMSTTVTIGGVPATGAVSVGDHTRLTAVTPAGTVGARDVVITTPGGSVTLSAAFTYT